MERDTKLGNIRTIKAMIRKEKLEARRDLAPEDRKRLSASICERFLAGEDYKCADTILLYKAYNNEVDTDMIFDKAIADGKKVAYPLTKMTDGLPDLRFYVISDMSQLTEGYMGIMEPDMKKNLDIFEGSADVCVCPGVAFDRKCHRLGYGKAFYDSYITKTKPGKVIGLAFEIQISDDFETEESDRAMDIVITDSAVYKR